MSRVLSYSIGDLYDPLYLYVDRNTGKTSGKGVASYQRSQGVIDGVLCLNDLKLVGILGSEAVSGKVNYGMNVHLQLQTPEGNVVNITVDAEWFIDEIKEKLYTGLYTSDERYAIIHYRGVKGLVSKSSTEYKDVLKGYETQLLREEEERKLNKKRIGVMKDVPEGAIGYKYDVVREFRKNIVVYESKYVYLGKFNYVNTKYTQKTYYTLGAKKHVWHLLSRKKIEGLTEEDIETENYKTTSKGYRVDYYDSSNTGSIEEQCESRQRLGANILKYLSDLYAVYPQMEIYTMALSNIDHTKLVDGDYGEFVLTGDIEERYLDIDLIKTELDLHKKYEKQKLYKEVMRYGNDQLDRTHVNSLFRIYLSYKHAQGQPIELSEVMYYTELVGVDIIKKLKDTWYESVNKPKINLEYKLEDKGRYAQLPNLKYELTEYEEEAQEVFARYMG